MLSNYCSGVTCCLEFIPLAKQLSDGLIQNKWPEAFENFTEHDTGKHNDITEDSFEVLCNWNIRICRLSLIQMNIFTKLKLKL